MKKLLTLFLLAVICIFTVGCSTSPKDYAKNAFEDGDMKAFFTAYDKMKPKERPKAAYEFINEFYALAQKNFDGYSTSKLKKAAKALAQLDYSEKTSDYLGILALIEDEINGYISVCEKKNEAAAALKKFGFSYSELSTNHIQKVNFYIAYKMKGSENGMDLYAVTGYKSVPRYETFGYNSYQTGVDNHSDGRTIAVVKTNIPGAFGDSDLYELNVIESGKIKIDFENGFQKELPLYMLVPDNALSTMRKYSLYAQSINKYIRNMKEIGVLLEKATPVYSKAEDRGNVTIDDVNLATSKEKLQKKYKDSEQLSSKYFTLYDGYLRVGRGDIGRLAASMVISPHDDYEIKGRKGIQIDGKDAICYGDNKEDAKRQLSRFILLDESHNAECYLLPSGQVLVLIFEDDKVSELKFVKPFMSAEAAMRSGSEAAGVSRSGRIKGKYRGENSSSLMDAISSTSESSLDNENGYKHSAALTVDGNVASCWTEGVDGLGEGENVSYYFDGTYKVSGLNIWIGHQKSEYLFYANARPQTIRVEGSNGFSQTFSLEDTMGKQRCNFSSPIDTKFIRITVLNARAGSKYKDTCIAEVSFF